MAENDDRWIPEVKGEEGKPSLQSINEVVKLIFQALHTLEGRVGEVSIRDSLRSLGDLTTERRLEILSLAEEPDVSTEGEVALYYDTTDTEFKISEDGGAWETFLPVAASSPTEAWSLTTSGTQTSVSTVHKVLDFDVENFDTDNQHDPGVNPSRATIATAGKYVIGACVAFAPESIGFPGTGYRQVAIIKGGAAQLALVKQVPLVLTEDTVFHVSVLVNLAVGEYVEVRVLQTSGEDLEVTGQSFWGHRLSD